MPKQLSVCGRNVLMLAGPVIDCCEILATGADLERDADMPTRRKSKKEPTKFEIDANGHPMLPDPDLKAGMELRDMAPMVRTYLTIHYREFIICT